MAKIAASSPRKPRASSLTGEPRADWERLRGKWNAFAALDKSRTQEWLAAQCEWTQGNVTQYLNGYIPLNLTALLRFARVMQFDPAEVSPTLAADLAGFLVVKSPEEAFSPEAISVAHYVDKKPPEERKGVATAIQILSGEVKSDTAVEKASIEFVAPNSPLRLRLKKDSITRFVPEPGDQTDLFRDQPKGPK